MKEKQYERPRQTEQQKPARLISWGMIVFLIILLVILLIFAAIIAGNQNNSGNKQFLIKAACDNHQLSGKVCDDYDTCEHCGAEVWVDHTYTKVSCTEDAVCTKCGKVDQEAVGHISNATCLAGAECRRCDAWVPALEHTYKQYICTACGEIDPYAFDPETWGFYSAYKGGRWVEVTGYSFQQFTGQGYAYYRSGHYTNLPDVIEFKDNILYDYDYGAATAKKPGTKIIDTEKYSVLSNDGVSLYLETFVICERFVYDGCLVLKTMRNNREYWYVLEDQIDWSKTEIIDDPEKEGYTRYVFWFK